MVSSLILDSLYSCAVAVVLLISKQHLSPIRHRKCFTCVQTINQEFLKNHRIEAKA